jgi:amidophosphoribosyltransferase
MDSIKSFDWEKKEECGIFGIYAPEMEVARTISLALIALQHRGQEGCGIATCKDGVFNIHKGVGLVSQVFNCEEVLEPLVGYIGIGHTRYSTSGKSTLENTQPVTVQTFRGEISIAQNGNLTTQKSLKKKLMENGVGMFRTSDSEVIAQMLASNAFEEYADAALPHWERRISAFMHMSEGAYALAMMTEDAVYACRDRLGVRPLCIGTMWCKDPVSGVEKERYLVASESCALVMAGGAKYMREVLPGEIIRIDKDGLHSYQVIAPQPALCIFEYLYFARPDSILENQLIVHARQQMGIQLAKESPCEQGDIVVGVPDSSVPAAMAYSRQTGIPYVDGLVKNRYVHRTFIQPTQRLRELGVSMKFTPVEQSLKGKRVVLVDDSIVRGTTIANIVKIIRGAGAKEIHIRISSPPVISPCFMGIDLSTTKEMVAPNQSVDQICKEIGADSLRYLTHEGMENAVKEGLQDDYRQTAGYCGACFTGKYPLPVDDW